MRESVTKVVVAFGLLLAAILIAPTASLAAEARGIRHAIPCFQCPPDISQSVHIARSTGAASVVLQTDIYDVNGIRQGSFILADPAGTFLAQQMAFTTSDALTAAGLPNGLFAAVLFDASLATNIFYEQIGLNAQGVAGILTGRGNLYNYFTTAGGSVFALVLFPEITGTGASTGLTNVFVCNNPANNMATFLGVPGPGPGQQAVATLVTAAGNQVINNFPTQNLFQRLLTQINPAGTSGGSLFLSPPGNTTMACVKFVRVQGFGTVGGYTY